MTADDPLYNPKNGHRHKSADAMARCWGCSDPGMLESSESDEARARQLLADGFRQVSAKYRRLARLHVPPFESVSFSPEVPEWLRAEMRRYWKCLTQSAYHTHQEHADVVELTPGEFRAFKKIAGGWRQHLSPAEPIGDGAPLHDWQGEPRNEK